MTGGISVSGQASNGVVLAGDVAGRFSIYSTVSSTGYGTPSRNAVNATQLIIQQKASEVEQGGAAVIIGANVQGGVYVGAQPANTATTSTADVDGDGITDTAETTGVVTSFGSAPAMVIGAAGRDVHIGALQFTTTPANPYGLIIAGTVAARASWMGWRVLVCRSGMDPVRRGGTVHIDGGALISGGVTGSSYGANATALQINAGSTVPTIVVSGTITAQASDPLPNATTGLPTAYTGTATGIFIAVPVLQHTPR